MRLTAVLLSLSLVVAALAQGEIKVTVDGSPVVFSGTGPQSVGGRVLVPLRGVMEKLGAMVGYDGPSKRITAQKGNIDLTLTLGSTTAIVNGQTRTLDVPAQSVGGVTMVPLRFMGEALGADIKWDGATSTIMITTSGGGQNTGGGGSETVTISGFSIDANGWVKKGQGAGFQLNGSPKGQASVIISGIAGELALAEASPGVYTGKWIPGADVFLKGASAIARLKVGSGEKLIQGGQTINVDNAPPTIKNQSNLSQLTVATPDISFVYADEGSGLNLRKITLMVGTKDVTSLASVNPDFIFFRPTEPLKNGDQVKLHLEDVAGNSIEAVAPVSLLSNAITAKVTIFDHTARQGVEPLGKINFRLDTEPGSKVLLSSSGGSIKDFALKESPAGIYRGVYQLKAGDKFNNDKVTATVQLPNGTIFTADAVKRISHVGTKEFGPAVIISPKAGATVANKTIITGTAMAGAKVNVRVSYTTTMLSSLKVNGNLADVTVTADNAGNWKTAEIDLGLTLKGSNTEYTITAIATDSAGKAAEATTVKVKG